MFQHLKSEPKSFSVSLYVESKDIHLGPFLLEIFPDMTLGMLKTKVSGEFGVKVSEQKWILGNALASEDKATLSSFGVLPDSYIFLYLPSGNSLKFNKNAMKSETSVKTTIPICATYNERMGMTPGNMHNESSFEEELAKFTFDRQASLNETERTGRLSLKHSPLLRNFNSHSISSEHSFPVMFDDLTKTSCLNMGDSKSNFPNPSSPHLCRRSSKSKGLRDSLLHLVQKQKMSAFKGCEISSPRRFSDGCTPLCNDEKATDFLVGAKRMGSLCNVDKMNMCGAYFSSLNSPDTSSHNIKVEDISSVENNALESDIKLEIPVQSSDNDPYVNKISISLDMQKSSSLDIPVCSKSNSNNRPEPFEIVNYSCTENVKSHTFQDQQQLKSVSEPIQLYEECVKDVKWNGDASSNPRKDACSLIENLNAVTEDTGSEKWQCDVKENLSSNIGINKEAIINYQNLIKLDGQDLISNCEAFYCAICFLNIQPDSGVVLRDCLHAFCRECLTKLVMYSEEAMVKCPFRDEFYSCESHLQQREIKSLVSSDLFEQYLRRSVVAAESRSEGSFHCRSPDCLGWCLYERGVNIFHCPICNHYNCLTCKAIHEGLSCLQYQKKLKDLLVHDKDTEKTQKLLDKMFQEGKALKCPKCQSLLMKKWGCDWLKCSVCQTEICWVTRGARWGPEGHGDISGGCRCGVNGVKCHPTCTYCH